MTCRMRRIISAFIFDRSVEYSVSYDADLRDRYAEYMLEQIENSIEDE